MTDHLNPVLESPDEDDFSTRPHAPPTQSSSARRPIKDFSPHNFFRRIGYQRMAPSGTDGGGVTGEQELDNLQGEHNDHIHHHHHGYEESGYRMQSPPILPHSTPPPSQEQQSPYQYHDYQQQQQQQQEFQTESESVGLGIPLPSRTASVVNRVPVGARKAPIITAASSPGTPNSNQGLLMGASPPLPSSGIRDGEVMTTVWENEDLSDPYDPGAGTAASTPGIPVGGPESPRRIRKKSTPSSSPMAKLFSARWPYTRKKHATVGVTSINSPSESSIASTPDLGFDDDDDSDHDDKFDDEKFYNGYSSPPSYCASKGDIHTRRTSWLSVTIFALSVYSTVLSGLWFVVAIIQPRWGRGISSRHGLQPSTATTIAALVAKSIEMSFVTVFVACLGQVLTRRALFRGAPARKGSTPNHTHSKGRSTSYTKGRGMTLAEMTMRNWVIQPGSLITHGETLHTAGLSLFGMLALTATLAATFYTTASDAMVAPKLKHGQWEARVLEGHVRASYANVQYASTQCPGLEDGAGTVLASGSCMAVQFSGQSYRNLINLMTSWSAIYDNGTAASQDLRLRPAGTTLLYDNTTMQASWIETGTSNVTRLAEEEDTPVSGRIVNNVTMAMPHPGVFKAATDAHNGILQPDDLAGVGEYSVRAGVVSPAINVMCVNMDEDELEPLVYTLWDDANVTETKHGQTVGQPAWNEDVPRWNDEDTEYLNRTVVDDIFRWGPKYKRRPPIFQLLPPDYNLLTNSTVHLSDAIYILGKSPAMANYTLCELRSWVSPNCSTRFDISGISGATMRVNCEDPSDRDSYLRSHPGEHVTAPPATDWKWFADSWRLSMDLDGGSYYNNASNARILTQLALTEPRLPSTSPSLAEALAVYASSTLTIGAIDTPFGHFWPYERPTLPLDTPGPRHSFNATVRTQEYTSGHVASWQSLFYAVLALVLAINLFCLSYFILHSGFVTDFTEPQNLFALAVNSPPSVQLKGSCGAGPGRRDLVVPWRVAYAPSAHHFFFQEANDGPWKGRYAVEADDYGRRGGNQGAGSKKQGQHSHSRSLDSAVESQEPRSASYKRLSARKSWL